jgi:Flp pilus assembly protein protease CpaA
MFLALCAISVYISLVDLKTKKITNRSLVVSALIFSAISIIGFSDIHLRSILFFLLISPILICFGIGAGDVKLLLLLSVFFIPFSLTALSDFLVGLSVMSAILIILHRARSKSSNASIAFAPAICGAVIWCARSQLFLPQ